MNSDPPISSFKFFESDPPKTVYKRLQIAEYNIIFGGGSHLYMALRAMARMRVELGIFCETKLTNDMYPRTCCGYSVVATQTKTHSQGGVALFYRSNASQWTIEGIRTHGPNVLSCTLIVDSRRWSLLGVYIPPNETTGETLTYLAEAVHSRCNHPILLLGDLNINFQRPDDDRSEDIATAVTVLGLLDLSEFFPKTKGHWTWSQVRNGRYLHSVTDYILSDKPDAFSRWTTKCPRGYFSDHRALIAELPLSHTTSHRRYLRH
jgi:exonuclease III